MVRWTNPQGNALADANRIYLSYADGREDEVHELRGLEEFEIPSAGGQCPTEIRVAAVNDVVGEGGSSLLRLDAPPSLKLWPTSEYPSPCPPQDGDEELGSLRWSVSGGVPPYMLSVPSRDVSVVLEREGEKNMLSRCGRSASGGWDEAEPVDVILVDGIGASNKALAGLRLLGSERRANWPGYGNMSEWND